MRIGDICTRTVVWCEPGTSVTDAAKMMRDAHIGNIVVAEPSDGKRIPIGVLTDRDIVIQVIAKEVDPDTLGVRDIMSREVYTVDEDEDGTRTIERMRFKRVRRMPVVDRQGVLVGIVALDDLLQQLAEDLTAIANVSPRARARETRERGS
ncbi:MAG: Hypoxic response protein 1 [Gammaproteobacteria bacterium]|nr:Hypoxic response protein 1 [Gammaproteobacteria bacterium]